MANVTGFELKNYARLTFSSEWSALIAIENWKNGQETLIFTN